MATDSPMPTFRFVVTYAASAGDGVASLNAAYMQQENGLVLFKDPWHGVVFAVNEQALITVQRESMVQGVRSSASEAPARDSYDQARHDLLDHGRSTR